MRAFAALAVSLLSGCASLERVAYDAGVRSARGDARVTREAGEVDGVEAVWLERAGDGLPIVLVHAFASEKDSWLPFVIELEGSAPLLVPDLPGHGESARDPRGTHDAEAFGDWLVELTESRGYERYHLAGVSSGATIAALHAAAYPERVASLALFAPVGAPSETASGAMEAILRGDNPLLPHDDPSFERFLAFLFAGEPPLPWPAHAVLRRSYIERFEWNEQLWDELFASILTLPEALDAIEAPTLVVWGDADRVAHPTEAGGIVAAVPDARLVLLRGCGHASVLERPADAAAALRGFLADP